MGPDGSAFYEISGYPEINESYTFLKQYYELEIRLEPFVEKEQGASYLVGVFRNKTAEVRFENLGGFFMPAYQKNVFDCSEMAALSEYYLERSGIRAKIAVSGNLTYRNGVAVASTASTPLKANFTHAFVLMDIPGGPYYLDPSRPDFNRSRKLFLVGPKDPEYSQPYYMYKHLFGNIYEVIKESHGDPEGRLLDQFDWWEDMPFRKGEDAAYR